MQQNEHHKKGSRLNKNTTNARRMQYVFVVLLTLFHPSHSSVAFLCVTSTALERKIIYLKAKRRPGSQETIIHLPSPKETPVPWWRNARESIRLLSSLDGLDWWSLMVFSGFVHFASVALDEDFERKGSYLLSTTTTLTITSYHLVQFWVLWFFTFLPSFVVAVCFFLLIATPLNQDNDCAPTSITVVKPPDLRLRALRVHLSTVGFIFQTLVAWRIRSFQLQFFVGVCVWWGVFFLYFLHSSTTIATDVLSHRYYTG